jgi:hypothetical protein
VDLLEALLLRRADALENVLLVCGRDVAPESDQELSGYRLLRRLLRRSGQRSGAAEREHADDNGEKEWYSTGAVHGIDKGVGAAVRLLVAQ